MTDRIEEISISFVKRNARRRGPTSSEAWNDQGEELSQDLSSLYTQWNSFLVPLTATLPDGTDSNDLDAFSNGLSGITVYVDPDATSSINNRYWNTGNSRPNSIFEQFEALYSHVNTNLEDLESAITASAPAAESISISDNGNVYNSSNVEDALQEVMETVRNLNNSDQISLSNGVTWESGTGDPEGVVVATPGSLFSRTDGGVSTTLYVKTSGTGNTGWTAK